MSFQSGRNMTLAAAAILAMPRAIGEWGSALDLLPVREHRYDPTDWNRKPAPVLRHVAIAKAKKKRAAKQARRQRRIPS